MSNMDVKLTDKHFKVGGQRYSNYATLDEALLSARNEAAESLGDVAIYESVGYVKFTPEPYEFVKV